MKHIRSAGGVVVLGNSILLLKKLNGDWVLPKGKLQKEEAAESAAVREVFEETRIKSMIQHKIGETSYRFRNCWSEEQVIEKRVEWFLMSAQTSVPKANRGEGFSEAQFVTFEKARCLMRHEDELNTLCEAIKLLEKR
ncbi:MAG: NUDIX domain-containing protein [Clostridia bacterium]|nr:NUDIX domain-containing protein [Clostridia bacterium]